MTQKDLAQKTNEKPSVIQDYESGKATPNPQILGKLERILGVKLRGMAYAIGSSQLLFAKRVNRCRYWEKAGGAKEVLLIGSSTWI